MAVRYADYVAQGVIVDIGNYVANIQCPAETNAVSIAQNMATKHNHNSFLWTVADIEAAARPAATEAAAAVKAAIDAAAGAPQRAAMYRAAVAAVNRPVTDGTAAVTIDGVAYKTRRGAFITALWDATHPAGPLLAQFKSTQLEGRNASTLYTFMAATLHQDKINSRAATVAAAVSTLVKAAHKRA